MIKKCNELSSNKIIAVSEKGRKFTIENNSKHNINKVTVDGCYITSGKRCDYLFELLPNENVETVFYVELKGKDIAKAIEQLEATVKICATIHKGLEKCSFIVASRVPKSGTSTQIFKKEFKKRNKHLLKISTNLHTEKI